MIYFGRRSRLKCWRDGATRTAVIMLAGLTLWGSAGARVLLECPLHEDTTTSDYAERAGDHSTHPNAHDGRPASGHEDHDCQCGYDCCLSGAATLAEAGFDDARWDPVPAVTLAAAVERQPFARLDPWFLPPANGPPVG